MASTLAFNIAIAMILINDKIINRNMIMMMTKIRKVIPIGKSFVGKSSAHHHHHHQHRHRHHGNHYSCHHYHQQVMQLVTNGGRLEPPNYCPGPLYGLMCQVLITITIVILILITIVITKDIHMLMFSVGTPSLRSDPTSQPF